MMNSHQYLSFNPRQRPQRVDKPQRHPLQLKHKIPTNNQDNPPRHFHSPHLRQPIINDPAHEQYIPQRVRELELGVSNYSIQQKESLVRVEEQRKKDDILKRVKQLQNLVLPLVEREGEEQESKEVGWQSRVQRRMLRVESSLDNVKKEWSMQMQRKLMRLQEELEYRYCQLQKRTN